LSKQSFVILSTTEGRVHLTHIATVPCIYCYEISQHKIFTEPRRNFVEISRKCWRISRNFAVRNFIDHLNTMNVDYGSRILLISVLKRQFQEHFIVYFYVENILQQKFIILHNNVHHKRTVHSTRFYPVRTNLKEKFSFKV
jgi:hypothetical protein